MKFNDGFWRPAPGMTVLSARVVRDVEIGDREVTVFAAARPIENRRHTLNNPLITVRLWSPAPEIIGVRIGHHRGVLHRGPDFSIEESTEHPVSVERDGDEVTITSGAASATVRLGGEWNLTFRRGEEVLSTSSGRSIGVARTADGAEYVHERLSVAVDEGVYGFGERSTTLRKNGQVVDTWNDDGGPSSWHSYKSIPFFLTDRGWGVFVNSPKRVSFEVASEFVSQVQFSVPGQSLEYFMIAGQTPKDVLRAYTGLTGRPALPPTWSFGLWLTTSFVTDYDEHTVSRFVDGMADRGIPISVFHFDTFWMREFRWCDFEWDPDAFPDPEGMISRLHEKGVRVSVWINPYIAQRSRLFDEARERGLLIRRANGDVWQWDTWQAGMGIVDFTDPGAREWYASQVQRLLDTGVDCVKTDFGERIPTDVVYADGSDPESVHNYYSYLYNETVFRALENHREKGDAVVFARAATVGGQQFPVHWGGDPEPTFTSMAETVRAGLSLGLSGFGFWSHDIGGFEGEPSPILFMRWAAFGLLSSHSRLHGSISYRVPWMFGEEAVRVVRSFTRLKLTLMPYLFAAALEAHTQGIPVMRAMLLEFPDDPTCRSIETQYMLGPDILVAPVLHEDGSVTFYVPKGRWTSLLDGRAYQGPAWFSETHAPASLPVLVRQGAVLPIGARDDSPDYDYRDDVILRIHDVTDAREAHVVVPIGGDESDALFDVSVRETGVEISAFSPHRWNVLLIGELAGEWDSHGELSDTESGLLVRYPAGTTRGVFTRR